MDLFGFEIKRKDKSTNEKSFVAPSEDTAIESIRAGGYYGTYMDLEGVAQTEAELIKRYRDIGMMADVDTAIEDIINESVEEAIQNLVFEEADLALSEIISEEM